MQVATMQDGARAEHAAAIADATVLHVLPQDALAKYALISVRVGSGHGSGASQETF